MILFNEEYDLEKKKLLVAEHNKEYYNSCNVSLPDHIVDKIFFLTDTVCVNERGVSHTTMFALSELTEKFLKNKIIFFNKLTLEPFNYHINNDPVVLHGNIYDINTAMGLPIYQKYLVDRREQTIKDCL